MNPIPSDDEFRQAYALVGGDHDALRAHFVSLLPAGGVTYPLPDRKPLARVRLVGTLAACLALASVTWLALFSVGPDRPVYALDGIHDRLLKVRSLYLKGWMYQSLDVDGKPTIERYPIERYVERPSRSWSTWHAFEQNGKEWRVRSGHLVFEGGRVVHASETDKTLVVGKTEPLAAELQVESILQQQVVKELIRGPTSEYRLAGTETLAGRPTLKYERVQAAAEGGGRCVLWLNATTGLPVRFAAFDIGDDGRERPSLVYDEIEVDVPPRPGMFSSEPPAGYAVATAAEVTTGDPFVESSAGAGNDRLAVRPSFAVDSLAVLVCWRHTDARPREGGREPDVLVMPELELSGPARRECEWIPLRTQASDEGTWRWGLAVPRDRRPLDPSESICLGFRFPSGSRSRFEGTPLRFDDDRLSKLLERIQAEPLSKAPSAPAEDEERLTPVRLRWKLTRILKQAADGKADTERSQQDLDLPLDDQLPERGAKRRREALSR